MQAGKTYVLSGVMVRKWKQNGIAAEPAYLERNLQSTYDPNLVVSEVLVGEKSDTVLVNPFLRH